MAQYLHLLLIGEWCAASSLPLRVLPSRSISHSVACAPPRKAENGQCCAPWPRAAPTPAVRVAAKAAYYVLLG